MFSSWASAALNCAPAPAGAAMSWNFQESVVDAVNRNVRYVAPVFFMRDDSCSAITGAEPATSSESFFAKESSARNHPASVFPGLGQRQIAQTPADRIAHQQRTASKPRPRSPHPQSPRDWCGGSRSGCGKPTSIVFPTAGCDEFHQVLVRIAKIEAHFHRGASARVLSIGTPCAANSCRQDSTESAEILNAKCIRPAPSCGGIRPPGVGIGSYAPPFLNKSSTALPGIAKAQKRSSPGAALKPEQPFVERLLNARRQRHPAPSRRCPSIFIA